MGSPRLVLSMVTGPWDNSRADGRWCGLNDEIRILRDLWDVTPISRCRLAIPATQSRLINTIYWCTDDPERSKSYDNGTPIKVGGGIEGDLLMIPGPLGLRWRDRLLPRLETGELSGGDTATPYRVKRWVELAPRIGCDSFIKLFAHGAQERNSSVLLQGGLESAFKLLVAESQRRKCEVYFVSPLADASRHSRHTSAF